MILRKNTYFRYYSKIPRHSNVTTSVLYETNWLIISYCVWCTCALNLLVLLRLHVPCGLTSCLQSNLYGILPVAEMRSRLRIASGIQLTDALMMPETNENLLFLYRDKNKKLKEFTRNCTVLFSGEVETIHPHCFAGKFCIFQNVSSVHSLFASRLKQFGF